MIFFFYFILLKTICYAFNELNRIKTNVILEIHRLYVLFSKHHLHINNLLTSRYNQFNIFIHTHKILKQDDFTQQQHFCSYFIHTSSLSLSLLCCCFAAATFTLLWKEGKQVYSFIYDTLLFTLLTCILYIVYHYESYSHGVLIFFLLIIC